MEPLQQYCLSTAVYVVRDDGKILLLKRAEGSALAGQFFLPGGIVENDELPIDGAVREVSEEAGLVLSGLHPVGSYPMHVYGERFLQLTYWAAIEMSDVQLSHEHTESQWVDPAEMLAFLTDDAITVIADGAPHIVDMLGHIRNDLRMFLSIDCRQPADG
ncbi:MAG: NUDIX hydrolase [Ilumatobacteraceae bacterium]